jgi:site-specific DNA recombinase
VGDDIAAEVRAGDERGAVEERRAVTEGAAGVPVQLPTGHSAARITRALNDAGVPCPSAADPGCNRHRTGAGWTLRTVTAILANPQDAGRQIWNLPEDRVISRHRVHAALVSEADFIAAQQITAPRGPAGPAVRRYLLAGLIARGRCGRRPGSCWSNGKPAYRCRHGYTSAVIPGPAGKRLHPGGPDPAVPGRHRHPPRLEM